MGRPSYSSHATQKVRVGALVVGLLKTGPRPMQLSTAFPGTCTQHRRIWTSPLQKRACFRLQIKLLLPPPPLNTQMYAIFYFSARHHPRLLLHEVGASRSLRVLCRSPVTFTATIPIRPLRPLAAPTDPTSSFSRTRTQVPREGRRERG